MNGYEIEAIIDALNRIAADTSVIRQEISEVVTILRLPLLLEKDKIMKVEDVSAKRHKPKSKE